MPSEREKRMPVVDAVETGAAFLLPALVVGLVVTALAGREQFVAGAVVGGVFGAVLLRLRAALYAVRTPDGVERRVRRVDGGWTARVADLEYDERYDRALAAALAVVGVAAFAALPFVGGQYGITMGLVLVGLFGVVASLLVAGSTT